MIVRYLRRLIVRLGVVGTWRSSRQQSEISGIQIAAYCAL
ncbi:hypothetical protein PROFUN_05521 [Planoprotostelium fungivorum]|uniref:Uncharacterized protein n=1 Tax=Planoprotostelium fungivorum TaxID=1890364 RepID=A0A2P6NR19_9EUKA|nr:hypothetical protein PROFUN_05521 [Planoprotostelium fungivorum]